MRTKTLLGLAVLAVSAATVVAQSNVYSLNIVGYVNSAVPNGFTYQSNPLDNGTNGASQIFDNSAGAWDNVEIHEFIGVGFKVSVFDSSTVDTTTGFVDRNFNPVPVPILGSGKGYLLNNPGASNNITYVGQVRGPGTNTLTFPGSTLPVAVGSTLPYAGTPAQIGFNNSSGQLDNVELEFLIRAPNGNAAGYRVVVFDSLTDDTTTGFVDRNFNPVPAPSIGLASGFFIHNPNSAPAVWTQVLTNSP